MEPEGASGLARSRRLRDEDVARRGAHPLAHAIGDADEERVPGRGGESQERAPQRGHRVAAGHERLAPLHAIGPVARDELQEVGDGLRRPFDQPHEARPRAQGLGEEERQKGKGHLRADVVEEAREAEGDDGPGKTRRASPPPGGARFPPSRAGKRGLDAAGEGGALPATAQS